MLLKPNFFLPPSLPSVSPAARGMGGLLVSDCSLRGQLLATTVLHQLHDPRYCHILPVLALTGCDTPSGHGNSWLIIGQCFISGHVRDPPPQQTSVELAPRHIPQLPAGTRTRLSRIIP